MERLTIKEAINIALERVDYYAHLRRLQLLIENKIEDNQYPSSADLFAEAVRTVVLLYPKKIVDADENAYGKMWVQEIDEESDEVLSKEKLIEVLNQSLDLILNKNKDVWTGV